MKQFKKWATGVVMSENERHLYKRILTTLDRLDDDNLRIIYLYYVKLANYSETGTTLKKPTITELAQVINVDKKQIGNLLSKAINAFYEEYYAGNKKIHREYMRKCYVERIGRLNNNIEFYNGQLEKLKRSGYSDNHNLIVKLTDSLEDKIKLLDEFKVKYDEI